MQRDNLFLHFFFSIKKSIKIFLSNRNNKKMQLKILFADFCEFCELCFAHETQNPTDTQIYVLHEYYIYDYDDG